MAFVVAAIWKAKLGEEGRIREVIQVMTPLSRSEPGNLFYQAQVSSQDPTKFFLYEQYTSAQAYEDHKATDHFQNNVVRYAIQFLEAREITTYETIGL